MARVTWEESERNVGSIAELDQLLDELHRGEPTMASVELEPNGDSLTIGLGLEVSVLNFVAGSGSPPYFTSCGGDDRDEAVCFRFMGELSEFPRRQTVPVAVARAAMRYFWNAGALDPMIQWEEA